MKRLCLHNLGIQKKKLCKSDNFLRGVEIKQKRTTHLCLGQLQPQMQKWGWIPSGHQAQILTPDMFSQLFFSEVGITISCWLVLLVLWHPMDQKKKPIFYCQQKAHEKKNSPTTSPCLKAKWKSRSNTGVPHCLLMWGHDHTWPSSHWHFWPIMINTKKKWLCEVWWNTFSHLLWCTFEGCFQNSCQIQYRSS